MEEDWYICNCICYSPLSRSGSRYSNLLPIRDEETSFQNVEGKETYSVKEKAECESDRGQSHLVYCTCRMPEVGDMMECSNCEEWFHVPNCSSPTQAALNDTTTSLWFCNKCNN